MRLRLLITGILFIAIFCEGILFFQRGEFRALSPSLSGGDTLQSVAQNILRKCKGASFRPNCYDDVIPKLMDSMTMTEAFEVTRKIQAQDASYYYCHTLGHDLSALEVRKNPEKWKEVARSCPFEMCSNGCIHGAFQERFRTSALPELTVEELSSEMGGLCEPGDGFEIPRVTIASCYHALGHLAMYVTAGKTIDIQKSLDLCDAISQKAGKPELTPICYDGVFMQIFQPLEPEDFALIEGFEQTQQTVGKFCRQWSEKANSSCWSEGWPLFSDEIRSGGAGADAFCSKAPKGGEFRCYQAVFSVIGAQNNTDNNKMYEYCTGLKDKKLQGDCLAYAVTRYLEIDPHLISQAIDLCKNAPQEHMQNACWDMLEMHADYAYKPGSENFFTVCKSLPEPWQGRCLAKTPRE